MNTKKRNGTVFDTYERDTNVMHVCVIVAVMNGT